jgi:hypothetical protein
MREITIKRSDTGKERKIKLRSLKRREIRELKDYGFSYLGCIPNMETAQDAVDKSLDMVLTEKDQTFLDECDNKQAKDLWSELLKETYGDPAEEKNLETTTDGTLTEKE